MSEGKKKTIGVGDIARLLRRLDSLRKQGAFSKEEIERTKVAPLVNYC